MNIFNLSSGVDKFFLVMLLFFLLCRQLAESGAHVVMAVRNTQRANELIQKWQIESAGLGIALNVEVSYLA
jgi:NAD(P)-dependent dehydrogenase (short-subunit alcohol dehydrogenase family)